MRGGRALPKFFAHFWSIKGVHFLKNANDLNFKLFFRLYTWPTKQIFCLYLRRILENARANMYWNTSFVSPAILSLVLPHWCICSDGVDPTANKREGNAYVTYPLPTITFTIKRYPHKNQIYIIFEGKDIFFPLLCDIYNVYLQGKCHLSLILFCP